MIVDLTHNKIIESTMTEAFAQSFKKNLIPLLVAKYGEEISLVQMYEDYIADGFAVSGVFFYPLTLINRGSAVTQWIKWELTKGKFDEKSPYAFLGDSLDFTLVDKAPGDLADKLVGRARFAEGGLVKIRIEMMARDITFLSGRYSQTFIDEMARQLTPAIEEAMSVKGVADSSLELCLVFSPESYMEHTSENVTYRRLLITDNSGAPKDFWIKWTRLDGATAYNVAAIVNSANVLFEIGEDVNQKIREKEYRFLLNTKGKDKYHNAMGRKNITDWRDIVKRLVKRGELQKVEAEQVISEETEELTRQLASVVAGSVGGAVGSDEVVASKESDEELLRALEYARSVLSEKENAVEDAETAAVEDEAEEAEIPEDEDSEELSELEEFYKDSTEEPAAPIITFESDEDREELARQAREALSALRATEVSFGDEDISDEDEPDSDEDDFDELDSEEDEEESETAEVDAAELEESEVDYLHEEASGISGAVVVPEEPCKEEYCEGDYSEIEDEESLEDESAEQATAELLAIDGIDEAESDYEDEPEKIVESPKAAPVVDVAELEAKIRAELEAKLRLEYEIDARKRAEDEAERLRLENEKLQEAARKQEELKAERERARAEETERLKAQIEAQLRAEARERERLADAARAAVEEQRRLEEEKARIERMRLEEERRAEAERQARELEARRAAEVDRITRETEARIRAEYEAKRAEQAREADKTRTEEATVNNSAEQKSEQTSEDVSPNYTYTSKNVKLQFRRSVDPNITARIHEIIKATLDYYGKSKVYLKIRATVPDSQTVVLEFVRIPMEEMELLGNIIKVLGNSGLGIAKAIVE